MSQHVENSDKISFMTVTDPQSYVKFLLDHGAKTIVAEKTGDIRIRKAVPGEIIETWTADGMLETGNRGKENHYVVTRVDKRGKPVLNDNGHENTWQISSESLAKKYDLPSNELSDGMIISPKGEPALFIEADRDIAIKAPWGEIQKIRAGGVLNISSMDDIYGIAKEEFVDTYAPVLSKNQHRVPKEWREQQRNLREKMENGMKAVKDGTQWLKNAYNSITKGRLDLLQRIEKAAGQLKGFVEKLNRHIARSHAESADDMAGGGVKIIPPNDTYQYGAILASHKIYGVGQEQQPDNEVVFPVKKAVSEKPGELQSMDLTEPKRKAREFTKVAYHPRLWDEATRVMSIRYNADAIIQFSKKIGFDIEAFCRKNFKDMKKIPLAEMAAKASEAIFEENYENRLKFHDFLKYEYIKTRHASVNDYRTLLVFDASSWRYSPFQSISTPFLSREEAQMVSEASKGPLYDKRIQFSDTVDINDLFRIKEREASKISLVPEPVWFENSNYFDDVKKMSKQLVEAAGEVYPHVDFTQMGAPDDKFFHERKEDVEDLEDFYEPGIKMNKYGKLEDIPWFDQAKDFMNVVARQLDIYFDSKGMKTNRFNPSSSDHLTAHGALITTHSDQMRTNFHTVAQVNELGDIYEKAHWLASQHEYRHKQAVHQYFGFPFDWDIKKLLGKYQRNVDKMPKDENGEPVFPEGYNVREYKRLVAASESLDDESAFSRYVIHENFMEKNREDRESFARVHNNNIGILPMIDRKTVISLNNSNPDDGFRISTEIEYASFSYVSMQELNNNKGRYKEMRTQTMQVPDTIEEFREAYLKHMQSIYPAIDMKKLAELQDYSKLKECEREAPRM